MFTDVTPSMAAISSVIADGFFVAASRISSIPERVMLRLLRTAFGACFFTVCMIAISFSLSFAEITNRQGALMEGIRSNTKI